MDHEDSFLLSDSISRRFELSPVPPTQKYPLSALVSPRTVHTPLRTNVVANPASLLGLGRSSPGYLSSVSPNLTAAYRDPFVSPLDQKLNGFPAPSSRVLPSADQLDLRLASSDNPTITMELDLDGNVRYLSSAWSQIVGTDLSKIIKQPVLRIIVADSVDDTLVFANAMHKMIVDDCSYRVTFNTPTNARRASDLIDANNSPYLQPVAEQGSMPQLEHESAHQKSLLSLSGSVSNISDTHNILQPAVTSAAYSQNLPPIDSHLSRQSSAAEEIASPCPLSNLPPPPSCASKPESVCSDDGYMMQLEAQGIMIHDQKTKLPSHSMWTIKPFAQLESHMTLPQSLVDILGFGSSILEEYMSQVHDQEISDEHQMPPPPTVLCRVCEVFIPAWFMERHLDLCVVEHRANDDLQTCQDALNEHREMINDVLSRLQASPLPSPLLAKIEYKGISLPTVQTDVQYASGPSPSLTLLHQLIGLADEALSINPAQQTDDGGIFISPNTEKAICEIIQWPLSQSVEPAFIAMIEDTQTLVDDKIETLSRLISTLQYLEKIKQEVDDRVLATVRDAIARIRHKAYSTARSSNETSGAVDTPTLSFTPPPQPLPLGTLLKSPQPQRSPNLIKNIDLGVNNEYPQLDQTRLPSSLGTPPAGPSGDSPSLSAMLDIAGTTARRPVTSSFQRNNLLPDSHTPVSSPLLQVVDTESSLDGQTLTPLQRPRGGVNGGSFNLSNPQHAALQKSLHAKPPLSPLLVSSPAPSSKATGSSGGIKDYEVIKPISKGAFGLVFLAKRTLTGEYVAIKCLKKRDMIAKNQVFNIKSERQVMMRQQDSPYVAQLYLSFQSKSYLYLVMEYLSGGDCAALVKSLGTLDVSWACRYIAQVIVGVDDLHMRGIIHRDLKPDNLLIDAKGHLKLTDFGLLRIGIVGRQTHTRPVSQPANRRPHRSSLTCLDAALEFFRANGQGSGQGQGHGNGLDDLLQTDQGLPLCDRRNSLNMFTLSPTTDPSRFTPQAASPLVMSMPSSQLASPTLAYLEAYPYQSGHRQSLFRNRARLGSNLSIAAADLPAMSRPFQRTLLDSSFAVVEDDYPASPYFGEDSPASNPVAPSYALYDPQQEGTGTANKFVGTPDYLAPEIIEGVSQGETSDWWLIGCILFEFLYGYPPFHADLPEKVFANILKGQVDWPPLTAQENARYCPPEAHDLIEKLLCMDPNERYGSRGAHEIKQHPFFKDIDWEKLFTDEPQFVPMLDHPELTDYFDSRGAELMQFPQDNDDDDEEGDGANPHRSNSVTSPSLLSHSSHSSLTVPGGGGSSSGLTPTGGVFKRDRRGSRLADPSEFGLFQYRNLAVLEKQNKDAINRLKNEHFEHRHSLSLGSGDFSPKTGRGRGLSIGLNGLGERSTGSGVAPLLHKRTGSPILSRGSPVVVRSNSSTSVRLALPHHRTEHTMNFMNIQPTPDDMDFADVRHSPQWEYPERTSHSLFRNSVGRDYSPSLSDTEDSKSLALLRVEKRRLSLRRVLAIRTNADGSNMSQTDSSSEKLAEWDVLYCEPIPIVCQSVCKILEKCGCVVVTARDGEDLVQRASGKVKFDLILTATRLAKVEAVDAVRLIKGTNGPNCNTPIIAVTGFAREAEACGVFDDVLEKPLQLALMQRAIVRALLTDEAILSDIDR